MGINIVLDDKRVKEMPMVDIAYEIFKQTKNNYPFQELIKKIAVIKGTTEEGIFDNLAQLYTELNIDGRFVHVGQNEWGLKSWFPVDQTDFPHFSRDDEDDDEDLEDLNYDEDDEDFPADETEEEINSNDEDDEDEDEDSQDDTDEVFVEDIDEEDFDEEDESDELIDEEKED